MNELTMKENVVTIESREVAGMVGKQHNELLKDIRRFIGFLNEGKIPHVDFFVESSYKDAKGEQRPGFSLTKQGCEMVANKLTGKKGTLFTAKYVRKFNEMEQSQISSYMISDPIERAKKWIEEEQQRQLLIADNEIKEQLIAEYEPKITYLDEILSSKNTLTITQIAADYGMSAQELNKILWHKEIQRKVGGQWVLYRNHMKKGYTKSKTHTNDFGSYVQTQWTQKGRLMIHDLLESLGHTAVSDEQLKFF